MEERKPTRRIMLGDVPIGGGARVSIQSMTNTATSDIGATLEQFAALQEAGCDVVRVAVPDEESANALPSLVAGTSMPVVADIHFDYKLALLALEKGARGIRINPGTIGGADKAREVAKEAAKTGAVIRVGVNSGSLESRLRKKGARAQAESLAKSALESVSLLEECGLTSIKISVKASDVPRTMDAYRIVADGTDWPLHVGITEAGTAWSGTIKSSVGIGALLAMGIGDTIRVSLTAPPVEEVRVARAILASLGLREPGLEVISCPTCARTEIDVVGLATRVEEALSSCGVPLKVAVMGCPVNGPGEALDADVGIAGGREGGLLFVGGKMVRRVGAADMFDELIHEVKKLKRQREKGGGV